MKNIRGILDLKHKKSLRLGLLLLSTLFIISASALVYAKHNLRESEVRKNMHESCLRQLWNCSTGGMASESSASWG